MQFRSLIHSGVALWLCVVAPETLGGTVAIRPTPILNVTLPTNTTYEVESFTNGSSWQATGVLVAGTGLPITLRLDGYSETLSYRFSRIGNASIILPATTKGWHLAGSFPGVGEVRVETNSVLAAKGWAIRDFVFPDATGSFVRALRPPLSGTAYFRGLQPATPLDLASLASYAADPNFGYAGFGLVADDMPQLYQDGYIAAACPAFYHRGGANAAAAGECYELTGPSGTTTVMVGDMDDVAPAGTCDAERTFFDIGNPAFAALFSGAAGYGTATYRLVPAPVAGNVKMVVAFYAGDTYFELRPYNYRAGISKLEVRGQPSGGTGGNWVELPRHVGNRFIFSGSGNVGFPIDVRVTSRFGEQVQFASIAAMSVNQRFTGLAQFVTFPEPGPAPVWILPPVYTDSLTNVLGGQWSAVPYGGPVVNPTFTGSAYQGTASLQISSLAGFSGVLLVHPQRFPTPPDGVLEFAIRSGTATLLNNLAVSFGGFDGGGSSTNSRTVLLPTITSTWQVLRIPVSPALAPAQLKDIRFMNNSGTAITSVLLDAIAFRQP